MDYVAQLNALPPRHDYFIGIDSDGCVFDSMETKHRDCFCPAFIEHFGLQAAAAYARMVWDFVNLYSRYRGCNRFVALQIAHKLMREWDVFPAHGVRISNIPSLDAWLHEETALANVTLEKMVAETNDPALAGILAWSRDVNRRVENLASRWAPFPLMRESLEKARLKADLIVVSQTPAEALSREWKAHGIAHLVNFIAGQEAGTKSDHIRLATRGHYAPGRMLMIGDAPGDQLAAEDNHALFFPIVPGAEAQSWRRFYEEGCDRFFNATFAGDYQVALIADFEAALPQRPPWQK